MREEALANLPGFLPYSPNACCPMRVIQEPRVEMQLYLVSSDIYTRRSMARSSGASRSGRWGSGTARADEHSITARREMSGPPFAHAPQGHSQVLATGSEEM